MTSTRATLLDDLHDPGDESAWNRFYDLYGSLIYNYARQRGLGREDSDDARSQCYEIVFRKMTSGGFPYDRARGRFRGWLRTIVDRRVVDLLRRRRMARADTKRLGNEASPEPSPEELWDAEWKKRLLKYCVQRVRGQVSISTFEAFSMVVLDERPVPEICDELGMTPNQIYKAKKRVLDRVKQELISIGSEKE